MPEPDSPMSPTRAAGDAERHAADHAPPGDFDYEVAHLRPMDHRRKGARRRGAAESGVGRLRSPSPSRFNPRTVSVDASPGHTNSGCWR